MQVIGLGIVRNSSSDRYLLTYCALSLTRGIVFLLWFFSRPTLIRLADGKPTTRSNDPARSAMSSVLCRTVSATSGSLSKRTIQSQALLEHKSAPPIC